MKSFLPIVTAVSILLLLLSATTFAQREGDSQGRVVHIQPSVVGRPDNFPNFVHQQKIRRPKIAVVLSGGGSRGIASVGVLQSLEQHGVPIDIIVGTSMGSIVGGLYAAGYTPDELKQLADTTAWDEVISYSDESARRDLFLDQKNREERSFLAVRFKGLEPIIPSAFSTGQRLTNLLNLLSLQALYHPDTSFDDLGIRFRAVATDLVSGKQIVLDEGNPSEAMRASMTVPLLYTPVTKDSVELVDGGLIANIPVDVARTLGADLVIAVDVTSPLRPRTKLSQFWEVGDQIMGIMMQASNREQLAKADIVVRPRLEGHLASDFSHLDSVIVDGKMATDSLVGVIETKLHDSWSSELPPDIIYAKTRIVGDTAVLSGMPSGPLRSGIGREGTTQRDIQMIVDRLYDSGKFSSVSADIVDTSDTSTISFSSAKYPVLKMVRVEGNHLIPTESILTPFEPLLNKNINARQVQNALKEVLRQYRHSGYSLARFRSINFAPDSGIASLSIDEGTIYRMDIVGTKKTRDYVIWRELPLKRNDVFEISKMAEGIRNLNGTNLFEQVTVGTHREDGRNVVEINVKERSTELIRLGMRIDNERGIQPSIDIRDEDFLGIGSDLGAGYFGGLRNRNYYGEFKATRIFNSYFTFNLRGYYKLYDFYTYGNDSTNSEAHWNRYRTGEYREEHEGVSAAFGTQLERLGTMTVEGRVESQRVWSTSGQFPLSPENFGISSIKVATTIDTKDRYPYPTAGVLMNLSYESALVKLIQAPGFTKFYFSYDSYATLFGTQTLHPRLVVGIADQTLPITEQFSIGGQNNFFGLEENDSRGPGIFVASLEYRWKLPFKIFFDTYFKARYDLGTLWPSPGSISLANLRHGIGVTVGLDTPIGPAEFSVGKSFFTRTDLSKPLVSYGPFITYFSIGYEL